MQRVFRRLVRGGVVLALAATLATLPVYGGEPDPAPQAKIQPPVGVAASHETSLFALFWTWLEAQAKISPPAG
jgi:hypothetical protein